MSSEKWKILIESEKKFIIISNIRIAVHTKYLQYFKENQVWAGYNSVDHYLNPRKQLTAAGHWFTNFPIKDRPKYKSLKILSLKNIPAKYKK